MTQAEKIKSRLLLGHELTSMDGFKMGIIRLTGRIHELRRGLDIKERWEGSGKGKYKVFYL